MSFTPAKPVTSSQQGVHEHLLAIVDKHCRCPFKKPISEHTVVAFNRAHEYWLQCGRPPLILDSACGTAESSRYFAEQNPDVLVIGIDRSAHRLTNSLNQQLRDNCLLLQCDCTDFWRLAQRKKWMFDRHYLLYPNPYPKPQHLQRRWHGHPAFSSLLAVSKIIELRTNWQIYAEEFTQALRFANRDGVNLSLCRGVSPITAFERKYLKSGHALWRVDTREGHC